MQTLTTAEITAAHLDIVDHVMEQYEGIQIDWPEALGILAEENGLDFDSDAVKAIERHVYGH